MLCSGVPKQQGKGKRKPPKLLQFGSTEPEVARECQDFVTPGTDDFNEEDMNDIALSLGDQNPCQENTSCYTCIVYVYASVYVFARLTSAVTVAVLHFRDKHVCHRHLTAYAPSIIEKYAPPKAWQYWLCW